MKKVATLVDDLVGSPYTLAIITYKELKDKVVEDSGMTETDIFLFDYEGERELKKVEKPSELKEEEIYGVAPYPMYTREMYRSYKEKEDRKRKNADESRMKYLGDILTYEEARADYDKTMIFLHQYLLNDGVKEEYDKKVIEYKTYQKNEQLKKKKAAENMAGAAKGIEQYNFIVEEDASGNWILLDGFNRLFGAYYPNNEKEVVLKIYPSLNQETYSTLIDNINTWKKIQLNKYRLDKDGFGPHFFDRGVKWSLFLKYRIDLRAVYINHSEKHSQHIYTSFSPVFFDLFNLLQQTGNIVENIDLMLKYEKVKLSMPNEKVVNYALMEKEAFLLLGKAPMLKSIEEILNFLTDSRFEKDISKLDSYSVPGYAENYFSTKVRPKMKQYVQEKIGKELVL